MFSNSFFGVTSVTTTLSRQAWRGLRVVTPFFGEVSPRCHHQHFGVTTRVFLARQMVLVAHFLSLVYNKRKAGDIDG